MSLAPWLAATLAKAGARLAAVTVERAALPYRPAPATHREPLIPNRFRT